MLTSFVLLGDSFLSWPKRNNHEPLREAVRAYSKSKILIISLRICHYCSFFTPTYVHFGTSIQKFYMLN